jgi:His-Xaa-Ser system protein HxsD
MSNQGVRPSAIPDICVIADPSLIGDDALLKTCYWFSRDFHCSIERLADGRPQVRLSPREDTKTQVIESAESDFLDAATDFELRSRIEIKTASLRELILAKAFAESGVLEDPPQGEFTDPVDKQDPNGLFKILNSAQF